MIEQETKETLEAMTHDELVEMARKYAKSKYASQETSVIVNELCDRILLIKHVFEEWIR